MYFPYGFRSILNQSVDNSVSFSPTPNPQHVIFIDILTNPFPGRGAQGEEPFSYKKLERHRCHDDASANSGTMIQGFGALLKLQFDELGQLRVSVASESTLRILGYPPETLFFLESFADVLVISDRMGFTRRLKSHHIVIPG